MRDIDQQAATLKNAAIDVRARIEDSLKGIVEREILKPVITASFSKVEHVVNPATEPGRQEWSDEQLRCVGDLDVDEEKFRLFAERLIERKRAA